MSEKTNEQFARYISDVATNDGTTAAEKEIAAALDTRDREIAWLRLLCMAYRDRTIGGWGPDIICVQSDARRNTYPCTFTDGIPDYSDELAAALRAACGKDGGA